MKPLLPFMLIVLGVGVIFAGFVYDILFAGIPYQDPTPALEARYIFHSQIASIIRWSGAGICVIGAVAVLVSWLRTKSRSRRG